MTEFVAGNPDKPHAVPPKLFDRLLGLVRQCLFGTNRDEKDVHVVDSVLASFFAHHLPENIDWDDSDSLWPILCEVGLRHCEKYGKRAQRGVWFKLTNFSLEGLRTAGVSEAVLGKLGELKNQEFLRGLFVTRVANILDRQERESYQTLVLCYAERKYEWPTVSIGPGPADDSKAGFEPEADDLPPEVEVEYAEYLDGILKKLSVRQRQVLELVLAGETQSDIAKKLGVCQATINHEVKCIRALLEELGAIGSI